MTQLFTKKLILALLVVFGFQNSGFAQNKQIAITIDDLPFVGEYRNFHLKMLMNTMKEQEVPATGFIIAREVRPSNWSMLNTFRDEGFDLGNHTYSHANLNKIATKQFIHEIRRSDKLLAKVMTKPKYFRYPYLAMGTGYKKNEVLCYLEKKHYHVAPITIDSKDFAFNQRLLSVNEAQRRNYLAELKPFYLEFIWQQTKLAEERTAQNHNPDQAQILLIHANLLNAYSLADIIKLYKENDYTFISLQDALKTYKNEYHCIKNMKPPEQQVINNTPVESFVEWD